MIQFFDHGFGTLTAKRPIPPCQWDRFDLLCVHRGGLRLCFSQGHRLNIHTAAGVLIYPHTRFSGGPLGKTCRVSVQHFALTMENGGSGKLPVPLARLADKRAGFERVWLRRHTEIHNDIKRAVAMAFEPQDERVHDIRSALLTLIVGQLEIAPATVLPAGLRAWEQFDVWLRSHLHRRVTLSEMARRSDLSESQFRYQFKEVFGTSPGRRVQHLRTQEAMRLLRETQLPIKEVARRLTYNDLPNFYRAFRNAVGCTPAAYRRKYVLLG